MNVNKINAENNNDSEYASMFKTLNASVPSYTDIQRLGMQRQTVLQNIISLIVLLSI